MDLIVKASLLMDELFFSDSCPVMTKNLCCIFAIRKWELTLLLTLTYCSFVEFIFMYYTDNLCVSRYLILGHKCIVSIFFFQRLNNYCSLLFVSSIAVTNVC